jgi:hypothetical protein
MSVRSTPTLLEQFFLYALSRKYSKQSVVKLKPNMFVKTPALIAFMSRKVDIFVRLQKYISYKR